MGAASSTVEAAGLAAGESVAVLAGRPPIARSSRRTVRALVCALLVIAAVVATWRHRAMPLRRLGAALTVDDGIQRGLDVAVLSMASPQGAALDAAKLYRRGLVHEIWIPRWRDEPAARRVEALGLNPPRHHEVARQILVRAGVPERALIVLDEPVEGLASEMAVVGAALRRRPTLRPIVLTARTHTARARLLLREVYAPAARALVRRVHADPFDAGAWWRSRAGVREVALEYAKWIALLTRGPSVME